MPMLLFILLLLLSIHLKISIRTFKAIEKARHLTPRQKQWNRLLVIALPFFWAFLLRTVLSASTPGTHDPEIKKRRKELDSHYYESMKGVYGY